MRFPLLNSPGQNAWGYYFTEKCETMEEFKWIDRVPCCIACAHELENSCKRTLERIIQHRHKCQKCRGCERLAGYEMKLGK